MSIEQHEQPKFESPVRNTENIKEESNVVEGPWKNQAPETETDNAEQTDQPLSLEEPKDNVIVGPWPGSGLEAKAVPELEPVEEPLEQPSIPAETEPTLPESESEREGKLEEARQKLNELPDEQVPEKSFDGGSGSVESGSEDEKARIRFSESYTKYEQQVCPKCKGTGRSWLLFKCSICKGLGKISTPGPTTTKYGYSEVDKKGNITEKITSETKG